MAFTHPRAAALFDCLYLFEDELKSNNEKRRRHIRTFLYSRDGNYFEEMTQQNTIVQNIKIIK